MKKPQAKNHKVAAEFLYRILLSLYPRSFRLEYGDLMLQAYRDLYQDAKENGGYFGVLRLWRSLFWDFASSIGWEYLDDYERSSGVKKIVIQELFRGLAIGWGTMIVLSILFKQFGWSSGFVLSIAFSMGLLSFVAFTIYRVKRGEELMIQTQRGWIVLGTTILLALLAYAAFSYETSASVLDNLFPIFLAFIVLVAGTWWGIQQVKKNS